MQRSVRRPTSVDNRAAAACISKKAPFLLSSFIQPSDVFCSTSVGQLTENAVLLVPHLLLRVEAAPPPGRARPPSLQLTEAR